MRNSTKLNYKEQKDRVPYAGEFYLQKDESFKHKGNLTYSIVLKEKEIGKVEETDKESISLSNSLLKILSLFIINLKGVIVEALELNILDQDGQLIANIRKKAGFFSDLKVYTKSNEHLATLNFSTKKNTPVISVISPESNDQYAVWVKSNLMDFSIENKQTGKEISTIKNRSLVHSTIRKNLTDNDAFFIDITQLDSIVFIKLISVVVALDIYYYIGQ
ncbi:hypothetical protein GLW07_08915 [Bacillus hwajinpoensis]|uniref:Scramblase n=1 Tax=Guptibacillus hwajinpoensis TaxID=208199 RepID=A0A845EY05_9BACL|nr:hypothetical protein [Pseudalkalibacillus hwajinpoensis]MYL63472.1 hypothetical protein [Pseudalkalibacillus hwajinpoensis]